MKNYLVAIEVKDSEGVHDKLLTVAAASAEDARRTVELLSAESKPHENATVIGVVEAGE